MPFAGTKVPVLGTKVPWQKDKCLNLYFSINSVKQQLISKKTLKDKNAEVKSAICRDKSLMVMCILPTNKPRYVRSFVGGQG